MLTHNLHPLVNYPVFCFYFILNECYYLRKSYKKRGKRCLVAVVGQRYAVNVMDEHVLRGNAAIIKCHIPSFVAEFVDVDSWVEDETRDIYPTADYGTGVYNKALIVYSLCIAYRFISSAETQVSVQ